MAEDALGSNFIPALYKPPSLLPIAQHERGLLHVVETHPVTIVVGQTGCGKSTQLPQFLYSAGWCADGRMVAITQPRRVAAATLAARVAEEMRCQVGQEVGYAYRFEDVTSQNTKIKFTTDGTLLREISVDPLLSRYSVIMVDEAHERSISSEILLGLLKQIRRKRAELRIIISSATLDAEAFLRFFTTDLTKEEAERPTVARGNAQDDSTKEANNQAIGRIISLEGRAHPVNIHYLEEPTPDYVERAVKTIFDINAEDAEGDILLFLTGREEIEAAVEMILDQQEAGPSTGQALQPFALYAGLAQAQQAYVFERAAEGQRKVIVSTNVAEASVTIDGIVYVIDCGFVKLRAYNPKTGIEILTATPVSKASATQRAGRAGRTKPGSCYRLYTEEAYQHLEDATPSEIRRSNFAPIVLQLKALGVENIARFDFFCAPPSELVVRALELLYSLGALDDNANLTNPLGSSMAVLPLEPMLAKALLSAPSFDCLGEMLTIAAMMALQGQTWVEGSKKPFAIARRKFAAAEGDHITLLNVYQAFATKGRQDAKWCAENFVSFRALSQAVKTRNQLRWHLERLGIAVQDNLNFKPGRGPPHLGGPDKAEKIRRCLTTGFFAHAAKMTPDGSFRTVNGGTVLWAHPSSLMFNRKADWVIFNEIVETGKKTFIRDISQIDMDWLTQYAPDFYTAKNKVSW